MIGVMTCKYRKSITLGENTVWSSGGTPIKSNNIYWNGDIPWISAISMKMDRIFDSVLYITEIGLKLDSRLAEKGSVLLLVREVVNCIFIGCFNRCTCKSTPLTRWNSKLCNIRKIREIFWHLKHCARGYVGSEFDYLKMLKKLLKHLKLS